MIGLTENKFFSEAQHINVILLFNNHIIMTHNDNEFELSETFISFSISFILVIKIMIFSHHLAKQI